LVQGLIVRLNHVSDDELRNSHFYLPKVECARFKHRDRRIY